MNDLNRAWFKRRSVRTLKAVITLEFLICFTWTYYTAFRLGGIIEYLDGPVDKAMIVFIYLLLGWMDSLCVRQIVTFTEIIREKQAETVKNA